MGRLKRYNVEEYCALKAGIVLCCFCQIMESILREGDVKSEGSNSYYIK